MTKFLTKNNNRKDIHMKDYKEVIRKCNEVGIILWVENGKLKYKASKNILSQNIIEQLKKYKTEIIEYLENAEKELSIIHDCKNQYEAFPLTEVQSAYLLGREDYFDYGNTACHIYQEFVYEKLDPNKVEQVWNLLIRKHEALRTVIYKAGYQKVMETTPHFSIQKMKITENNLEYYEKMREDMGKRVFQLEKWPMFEIAVSEHSGESILHFSMDFLIADWISIWQLLEEFEKIYFEDKVTTDQAEITFRDYVLYTERWKKYKKYDEDKMFWKSKIEQFFSAPLLPQNPNSSKQMSAVEFERYSLNIAPQLWENFKRICSTFNITPTAAVLTIYSEILKKWSSNKDICLNLTVLNREAPCKNVYQIIGDFTKIVLLEVENKKGSLYERMQKINADLFESLDHCGYSGVDVIRDIAKVKGREYSSMPFVFTSAIGVIKNSLKGRYEGNGISQTPQVFIDCQAMDGDFGLQINWDVRKGIFQTGIVEDMFTVFENILNKLALDDNLWGEEKIIDLPTAQKDRRNLVNGNTVEIKNKLLYEDFLRIAEEHQDYPAVYDSFGTMSYGELRILADNIAERLKKEGVEAGDKIIISIPKNRYQIGAVLAVLFVGGVYVPVDVNSPVKRTASIIEQCNSKVILKTTDVEINSVKRYINVDTIMLAMNIRVDYNKRKTEKPAYIIFTSGTTGTPKGVVVSHKAAWNTISAINDTYKITHNDCIFALSKLSFDLSVYDIFGMLSVGGSIAYVDDTNYMNPECWFKIINQYNVTIWNSVPALRSLYLSYLKDNNKHYVEPIRLSLLSGDWIPKEMPEQILYYNASEQIICLGGATEAGIWSIYHEYTETKEWWNSIPYGKPLRNQKFFIVDEDGEDCPDWCPGELLIAGESLGEGYLEDEKLTSEKFFYSATHNCRVYATGDIGRYMTDGEIEFLGRMDGQVKIHGYRIELGEVESVLEAQDEINRAVVRVNDSKKDLPIEAAVEIEITDLKDKQAAASKYEYLLKNIENVNADYEKELKKTNFKRDFVERDEFAFASILKGLEKLGCFSRYCTHEEILNNGKINSKYKWVVDRWLKVLKNEGYLEKDNDCYFLKKHYSEEEYNALINEILANWRDEYGDIELMNYIGDNGKQISEILLGKVDPVGILYPEGSNKYTSALYVTSATAKVINQYYCSFISEYVKMNPDRKIRILEIGAGTGATAKPVIRTLGDANYEYYFTDITKYFLPEARKEFKNNPKVIIQQLNIDEDYTKQGFQPNYFDIIIGAYVLENVKDIRKSINIIKELMAPQGYLLFSEPVRNEPWILASQALMMTKPEDEYRKDIFFVEPDCWKEVLDTCDDSSYTNSFPSEDSPLYSLGAVLFIKQFKTNKKIIDREKIKERIQKYIPHYMEPSEILYLDSFPLTINAKIDIKKVFEYLPEVINSSLNINYDNNIDSELEKKLLIIWKDILGTDQLGTNHNFYDYGADSLLMAQATTKMREKLNLNIPFETLLRATINGPTVYQCAEFILNYLESEEGNKTENQVEENNLYYVKRYSDIDAEGVRIFVHGAIGNIDNYSYLGKELAKYNTREVIAFGIANYSKYMHINTSNLILELAEQYTSYIVEHNWKKVQLIGYSFSGSVTLEMARLLLEQGINVDSLIIIEGGTIPVSLESKIVIELLFLDSIGIPESVLGFKQKDILKTIFNIVQEKDLVKLNDSILRAALIMEEDKKRLEELLNLEQNQRFEIYQQNIKNKTILKNIYPVYEKSLNALKIVPNIYFGDVTYCSVKERNGAFEGFNELMKQWDDVLLGNVEEKIIDGNHYSCMNETYALDLAKLITEKTGDDGRKKDDKKNTIVDEHFLERNINYIEFAVYKRKESILYAMIRFMKKHGIFENEDSKYSFEEIRMKLNVIPQNEKILKRWITVLKKYGIIEEAENKYFLYLKITEGLSNETWNGMLKLWDDRLCNKLANEYLANNIKSLSELFSGKINATHLLFPEGKFDYANALYKDTYIFKYFNSIIYRKIKEIGNSLEKIQILEIGAGTGASTDVLLPLIRKHENVIYHFTDISSVFLKEAKRRYFSIDNILFRKLDINSWDFEEKVNVVIANGVLNNAKNIRYTIDKLLGVLQSNGVIFIIEQVEESLEMLVSQVFMMEDVEDDFATGGKTFKSMEEWIEIIKDERIDHIEVLPDKYYIEQKLFVIYSK